MAADFTADYTGDVPRLTPVTFEYTGDPVPAVVGYAWDFGDGQASNEAAPTHFWWHEGPQGVTLTVLLDDDTQATVTKVGFVTIVADDVGDYLDLLITKFKGRATIRSLLSTHLDQQTILDHVASAASGVRSLDGVGVALDTLGEVLGLPRLGRVDVDYREALARMVYVIRGHGQLENLIEYVYLYLDVEHLSAFSGGMRAHLDVIVGTPTNYTLFKQRLQDFAAAGTRVDLTVSDDGDVPLEFEYTDEPPLHVTGNELSELDYEDYGFLAEEI